MKKTELCAALLILIGLQGQTLHAAESSSTKVTAPKKQLVKNTIAKPEKLTQKTPQKASSKQAALPSPLIPDATKTNQNKATVVKQNTALIDCNYRVPDETNPDPAVLLKWAEHAVAQAFEFNPSALNTQLQQLKSCFTENGWLGFNSALLKSGNLNAIKTQNLNVSSIINGKAQLIGAKENQWKIIVPVKVIYQNEEDAVTHSLSIYITVSWRNTSGFGIMQMITMPTSPPIAHKSRTLEESVQSLFSLITMNGAESVEGIQKNTAPFITSLFPITTRTTTPFAEKSTNQAKQVANYPANNQDYPHLEKDKLIAQIEPPQSLQANTTQHQIPIALHQQAPIIDKNYYASIEAAKTPQLLFANTIKFAVNQVSDFKIQSTKKVHNWATINIKLPERSSDYIETVKTNQLTISNPVDAEPRLIETKNNQWKITVPIQVAFQSDKGNVTQKLNVDFTVHRSDTGSLEFRQSNANKTIGTIPARSVTLSASDTKKIIDWVHSFKSQQTAQSTRNVPAEHPVPSLDINCNLKIPANSANIDTTLLLQWAEYAVLRSFKFDAQSVNAQLQQLEPCFTNNGWAEFKTALQNSGNLEAIQTLNLIMNSETNGTAQLISSRDNEWIISLPIKVAYQNNTNRVTQILDINLTIGRKTTGELGIIHMNAKTTGSEETSSVN